MRFFGNGIVKVGSRSYRFTKPAVRYEKGYFDTDDVTVIATLTGIGFENDGNFPESMRKKDPGEKDALIKKAEELGIEVKGTWGVKKLTEAISEAEKPVDQEEMPSEELNDEDGED